MQTVALFLKSASMREWNFFIGGCILAFATVLAFRLFLSVKKSRKRRAERKKEEIERDAEFTLPDRENEFVKERLKNHLRLPKKCLDEYKFSECVPSFDYTRGVLSKLKAAPLSVADRMHTQNISKDVTRFAFQERLSPDDVRLLNDRLSEMIKLSAKYLPNG